MASVIEVLGACEHNLKNIDCIFEKNAITIVTGVSGSGKSSLAFDTILAESQRRFFHTLSNYTRQYLEIAPRPAVRALKGLSPAIALAQRETTPSRKATVGTLTDLSELLGIVYANYAVKLCPKHWVETTPQSLDDVIKNIQTQHQGETLALCINVAHEKKGTFRSQLTKLRDRQFLHAWVDGVLLDLTHIPPLSKEQKHTIKVVVDQIRIKDRPTERLRRSLETCLREGEGFGEFYVTKLDNSLDLRQRTVFSSHSGCGQCGFSWPKFDTRYFSANSLGKCDQCDGYGSVTAEIHSQDLEDEEEYWQEALCQKCSGTGISSDMRAVLLNGKSIHDLLLMTVDESFEFISTIETPNPAFARVRSEILEHLQSVKKIGLGYLHLARRVRSLSGGEQQRLKLAGILAESLRGVLYVFDEPSQGLHPSEIRNLFESLRQLKNAGNTVIIVDHDEELMRRADWIIDLGPKGGADGGRVMARFRPEQAKLFANVSRTALFLSAVHSDNATELARAEAKFDFARWIVIQRPKINNLKMTECRFPIGGMTSVTGVSGSGKASLVMRTLYEGVRDYFTQGARQGVVYSNCQSIEGLDPFETVTLIDRRPVAKSSHSMPATYLDVLGELRELYASLPEAKVAGLNARSFSLHGEGGRCPECKGKGEILLQMRFLADARVRCPVCLGARFRSVVLDIKFNSFNLAEVLDMTIDQCSEVFKNHRSIENRLKPAQDIGLGYLKMGQPSSSLSGGESQRLKLVPFFQKKYSSKNLVVVDEPTVGLHFDDIQMLKGVLLELRRQGATVVIVDNSKELLAASDYHIHLGPQSADAGGEVVHAGSPMCSYLEVDV